VLKNRGGVDPHAAVIAFGDARLSGRYQVIATVSQSNGANAPTVFHMPIQIKFSASGFDTTVVMPINTSAEIDTFNIAFSPTQVVLDPNSWLLKKVTYLGTEELAVENSHKPLWQIYPNPMRRQLKINYN